MQKLLPELLLLDSSVFNNFYIDFPFINTFYDNFFSYLLISAILGLTLRFISKLENSTVPAVSSDGFTLVELLVVISIIAILAVFGLTLFGNAQKNARDARRRADINVIAKALEVNKAAASSTYNALSITASAFANAVFPADSGNQSAIYCISSATLTTATFTAPTTWLNSSPCPNGGYSGSAYALVNSANSAGGSIAWSICALLESGTNPANIYCKSSSQ